MSTLLEVDQVSHRFRGLHVLRDVNLAIAEHSITGLIGPNGAGKTTLFNIISGFLRPLSGTVVFAGRVITTASVRHRSFAGLVRTFQTPQVFADMTVRENLMAGWCKQAASGLIASLLGVPRPRRELAEAEAAAEAVCATFGLDRVKHQLAGRLPAGQQRLVELARAAVGRPRLLCLDEPSAGASHEEASELMAALRRLNDAGTTILLVSHDMELMAIGSAIHVLCFGEIIASGTFAEVQSDSRVRDAYLGT